MADVALKAGVSLQTVSRAINNKEDISSQTRQHVLKVVQDLGYRPSGIARSLATQRTTTIGLLVPDIANPFFSGIARGIEDNAHANAYNVFLCNADEDTDREEAALNSFLEKRVDGLILCSSRLNLERLLFWLEQFKYVVLFNRMHKCMETLPGVHSIYVDDAQGTRDAVKYLAGCGRRCIAMLSGPQKSWSSQKRLNTYRQEMTKQGLKIDSELIVHCSPDFEGGATATEKILRQRPEIDAILAFNDLVAVGACHACHKADFKIPERIAIVGSDDIPLASYVHPGLTTLRSPQRLMGKTAMETLIRLFRSESAARESVFEPQLVVRDSTP
jgi:LacI family transcriptional regulator